MKVSKKLHERLSGFSTSVAEFSKNVKSVEDSITEMKNLIEDGEEAKKDMTKFAERTVTKLRKIAESTKNFSKISAEIVDEAEELLKATPDVMGSEEEKANFSRKLRIISRNFADSTKKLQDITTEAESVVEMTPESAAASTEKTQTHNESTAETPAAPTEAGAETQPKEVQTPAATVNFSVDSYREFAAKNAIKSFAEIMDDVDNASDLVKEVVDEVVVDEPTAENTETPPADGTTTQEPAPEAPATPAPESTETPSSDTTTETTEETASKEVPPAGEGENHEEEPVLTEDEVVEFGEEMILEGDESKSEELNKKLEDLEKATPGAGEKVMAQIENFSVAAKKVRNFSKSAILDKVAEFCNSTTSKLCSSEKIDVGDLSAKAEQLEKNLPGAGEVLTTVCECFGKIIDFCGGRQKNLSEEPKKVFCDRKAFSEVIDKFLKGLDVADKKFARAFCTKCFALQDAIEDQDDNRIKETVVDVAQSIDGTKDSNLKEFGEKLVHFSEELEAELAQAEEKPAEATEAPTEGAQPSEPSTVAVPEEVEKADQDLNAVLDKIDEGADQLKPEVVAFAKKLCSAYKSVKCFTEEQLEAKLADVESLQTMFDESKATQAPAEEVPPAGDKPAEEQPTAPQVEEPKNKEVSNLVEENEIPKEQLPSDSSVANFSTTAAKPVASAFDPIDHLYSLNIR